MITVASFQLATKKPNAITQEMCLPRLNRGYAYSWSIAAISYIQQGRQVFPSRDVGEVGEAAQSAHLLRKEQSYNASFHHLNSTQNRVSSKPPRTQRSLTSARIAPRLMTFTRSSLEASQRQLIHELLTQDA